LIQFSTGVSAVDCFTAAVKVVTVWAVSCPITLVRDRPRLPVPNGEAGLASASAGAGVAPAPVNTASGEPGMIAGPEAAGAAAGATA
jgi:hypothetical protein